MQEARKLQMRRSRVTSLPSKDLIFNVFKHGYCYKLGVLLVGVFITPALLLEVCITASDSWKRPEQLTFGSPIRGKIPLSIRSPSHLFDDSLKMSGYTPLGAG